MAHRRTLLFTLVLLLACFSGVFFVIRDDGSRGADRYQVERSCQRLNGVDDPSAVISINPLDAFHRRKSSAAWLCDDGFVHWR